MTKQLKWLAEYGSTSKPNDHARTDGLIDCGCMVADGSMDGLGLVIEFCDMHEAASALLAAANAALIFIELAAKDYGSRGGPEAHAALREAINQAEGDAA